MVNVCSSGKMGFLVLDQFEGLEVVIGDYDIPKCPSPHELQCCRTSHPVIQLRCRHSRGKVCRQTFDGADGGLQEA